MGYQSDCVVAAAAVGVMCR